MSKIDTPESNSVPNNPVPSKLIPGSLLKQCCVCMRKDTKLLHLCLVNGGGNSLFSLLCDDQEDSSDGAKKPTHLIICTDCDGIMSKILRFRQHASKAQKRLSNIAEGRSIATNSPVLIPPISSARGSGPEAILEYRAQTRADLSQPLLRVVRYVLPEGSAAALPLPSGEGSGHQSSLLELLEGINQ